LNPASENESKVKVEVNIPPSPSLLTSFLLEGLLKIRSKCPHEVNAKCLNKVWSELEDKLKNKQLTFRFVGNDMKSVNKVLNLCKDARASSSEKEKKGLFNVFIECLKKLELKEISVSHKISSDMQLIGSEEFLKDSSKAKQRGYSFQVMKTDRYQGVASLELGLIKEQVTLYSDLPATYLFFLGLTSSLIADVNREDFYFLLYDTSLMPQALERPDVYTNVKDDAVKELFETISTLKNWSEEVVTLSILFNAELIKEINNRELGSVVSFRLLRIRLEGNTYKVYNDVPLNIYVKQKIYENLDLVEALHESIKDLTPAISRFLRGDDPTGEGQHAYLALKHLYAFATTGNYSFLTKYYRELMEAYKASGGVSGWYLNIASRFFTKP